MPIIEAENLSFGYTKEKVIKNINFTIDEGQIVAVHGENGSGKSTFLKLILGELKPETGSIKIDSKNLSDIKDFRHIGYVPQVQNFNDIGFPITTREIVVLNLYKDFGFIKIPRKKHNKRAEDILNSLGLSKYLNTPYNELSGGFKQRTMIARALINKPKILILDEPTAGVDKESKESFLQLINETNKKSSVTTLIVTHEMELINKILDLDKTYKMEEGGLIEC